MAGSVNKVILVGNLGKDVEVRNTQDGREIGNITLATSETWKDKNSGERKEKTEWHRVVIFNDRMLGAIKPYLKKGTKVYVEGSLQTRKWTDPSGQEKYTTEVVIQNFNGNLTLLDSKQGSGGYAGASDNSGSSSYTQAPASAPAKQPAGELLDDEIPF